MKKALIATFWITLTLPAFAQVNLDNVGTPFLCQPGVFNKSPGKGASFTYSFNPDFQMNPPNAENPSKVRRNERFAVKLKAPLVMKENFKAMLGFNYSLERYHFNDINPENYPFFNSLNETDLKTAGIAAYFLAPINHKYYTSFRLSAAFHGDYGKFISLANRYGIYRAAGVFGVKKRYNLEYGVGLLFSKSFRSTSLLPFGFYNQTFNEHWGIETSIPVSIKGRYNFDERTLVMFGTEYSSQSYAMNVNQPSFIVNQTEKAPFHFQRSSIDLTTSFYRQLSGWTWLEFKMGYAFNLNSKAEDLPQNRTYNLKPSGSMVGMLSFFISPPKHFMKGE